MENQHQKISGYRDLSQAEIDHMNLVKNTEVTVGETWRAIMDLPDIDKRWANIARTHFEEGFSALVRSVAKPEPRF